MTDELESMKANLTKAQGLVADVRIAAEKLPNGEGVNNLLDYIENAEGEISEALSALRYIAQNADTDTSADGIVIPDDGGDE